MNALVPSTDIKGKVALVTDIANPLGFAIAEQLVKAGAIVHVVNPDHRRCLDQVHELAKSGAAFGHVVNLQDGLAAMQFAYQLNEEVSSLDIIVSNCRIASVPALAAVGKPTTSPFETLGELALVQELMDGLRQGASESDPARVVLVGSFENVTGDGRHKSLAAHAQDVAARLKGHRVALNLIQAAATAHDNDQPSTNGLAVVSAVLAYVSASASQRYGELVSVAA